MDAFIKCHEREPRVLHIGNIANNAYNNAKLLNEAGLDCDVLCYDYYHIMGCPEWEDADFTGSVTDDFRPQWFRLDLGGFQRPRWFSQGPQLLAIQYLHARRSGLDQLADTLWQLLLEESKCCPPVKKSSCCPAVKKRNRCLPDMSWVADSAPLAMVRRLVMRFNWHVRILSQNSPRDAFGYYSKRLLTPKQTIPSKLFIKAAIGFVCFAIRPVFVIFARNDAANSDSDSDSDSETENMVPNTAISNFKAQFGERNDQLEISDVVPYMGVVPDLKQLFAHYDYVIGYSTDPVLPMLCGTPYFAFEHGTIRDIPYSNSVQGRLTALAYRMAKHVFVTNFDCKPSADYLAPGRFTLINHPYDEDHGLAVTGSQAMRKELVADLQSSFIFFHPTRHDWVSGTGYADKQNEIFLRAFAELRTSGVAVGLICCEWGANVEESKRLLAESGCSQFVRWIPPQAITPFERYCLASDVVVDQFKLGAFGGVVFKAMAVGTPILTFLDVERLSKQYPVCPPVLNCRTQEEIVLAIRGALEHPDDLKALGGASREWMKRHHAKEQTVNAQVDQFRIHMPHSELEFSKPLPYREIENGKS
ncbi:MAG: glycosyltransferase [Candidatus Accumulibacter sp.]|uniref:Glycosyltransferase n=1 Tax=Candidatus Accumulibacter proximus TaxID=2954385 RepID=A0A935PYT8_9PROT|nr:glycosyltransferase [Candidatus Accumulibacter proximus]